MKSINITIVINEIENINLSVISNLIRYKPDVLSLNSICAQNLTVWPFKWKAPFWETSPVGYATKFYRGISLPFSLGTPCTIFTIQKRNLFHIPSIEKWHAFDILCILFNFFKRAVFKIWINHKTRAFLQHFHSINCIISLFTEWSDRVPFPSICFNL